MAQPKKPAKKAIVDTSIVSKERIEELRVKAAEKVEAERIEAAEAQLLEQFANEERQQHGLEEGKVEIVMDFAPYCDRAMIDGVVYFQGRTYTVKASLGDVLREMMANTWKHQSQIDGKSENFYRQSRGQGVTPAGVVSNILRA